MVGPGTRPTLVQHHSSLLDVRRSQALCTGLPVPSSELARMAKEGCDSGRAGAAHDRAAGRARSGSAASAAGCLYTASATDCLSAPCATTSAAFHESSSGTSCRQGSCCDCWAAAGQQPGAQQPNNGNHGPSSNQGQGGSNHRGSRGGRRKNKGGGQQNKAVTQTANGAQTQAQTDTGLQTGVQTQQSGNCQ